MEQPSGCGRRTADREPVGRRCAAEYQHLSKLANGTIIERDGAAGNTMNGASPFPYTGFNGYRIKRHARSDSPGCKKRVTPSCCRKYKSTLAAVIGRYYDVQRQEQVGQALTQPGFRCGACQGVGNTGAGRLANDADLFQARIDLNASEQALGAQQLAIRQAKLDLSRLLAVPGDSTLSPTDSLILDQSIPAGFRPLVFCNGIRTTNASAQVVINEQLEREITRNGSQVCGSTVVTISSVARAKPVLAHQPELRARTSDSLQVPIYNGGAFERQHRAKLQTENAGYNNRTSNGFVVRGLEDLCRLSDSTRASRLAGRKRTTRDACWISFHQRFATSQATVLDLPVPHRPATKPQPLHLLMFVIQPSWRKRS